MQKINLNQIRIYLRKVLWITFAWIIISHLLFFYENGVLSYFKCNPEIYNFKSFYFTNLIASLTAGIIGGSFVVLLMEKWLRNIPYLKALFYIFVSFTLVFLFVNFVGSLFFFSQLLNKPVFSSDVLSGMLQHFIEAGYVRSYFAWLFIVLGTLIVLMVNDKYGPGVFVDFLLGKYFKPKREERIFMFLDLRSSTSIAEKLGEEKYFNFINDVFKFATPAILDSKGEIYQYVGDEVIVSWKTFKGMENANCIQCFLHVQKALLNKGAYFKTTYGIIPEFKAGIHYGHVMAGEIGIVKRDIVFSGDVLNTTARIQSKCNELKVDLLFSKYLLDKLTLPPNLFEPRKMGDMELRGKAETVSLYTV